MHADVDQSVGRKLRDRTPQVPTVYCTVSKPATHGPALIQPTKTIRTQNFRRHLHHSHHRLVYLPINDIVCGPHLLGVARPCVLLLTYINCYCFFD
jgi:hypothetical protein